MDATNRKRTAVACGYCRKRKRRCDGFQPTCTLCADAGVECNYDDTDTNKRKPDVESYAAFLNRLSAVEDLVREHSTVIARFSPNEQPSSIDAAGPSTSHSPYSVRELPQLSPVNPRTPRTPGYEAASSIQGSHTLETHRNAPSPSFSAAYELPPMTIPLKHRTTTASLITSDLMRNLLGEFPADIFVKTEAKRELPDGLSLDYRIGHGHQPPSLHRAITDPLVESYFSNVHAECPILQEDDFMVLYRNLLSTGLRDDPDSALCLMVLALGSATAEQLEIARNMWNEWVPGLPYVSQALQLLLKIYMESFGTSLAVPQALLLAAKYFGYLARPLQSWRFVHMASTNLQHLCNQSQSGSTRIQSTTQLASCAWAIFDTECDLIAEHRLPHSGIEHVVDAMEFPSSVASNSPAMLSWLAELSARRLLNRVHHVMYANTTRPGANGKTDDPSQPPISSLLKISRELDRQLETWFDYLPQSIKPTFYDGSSWGLSELNILLRYYSTKDIVFRLYVLYACSLPSDTRLPDVLLEACNTCLTNCRAYLDASAKRLEGVCSHREILLHSVFASIAVLTLASLCPQLASLVCDINELQFQAVSILERFAIEGSCIQDLLDITSLMNEKCKILNRK